MRLPSASAALRAVFAVDLRALAALRIALGVLLLVDLALRFRFLEESYTDLGVWPREVVDDPGPLFAFHLASGSASFQMLLFALAAGFAASLVIGHWTRIATAGSWLLLTSLQLRHEGYLDGGDVLLRALLLWGLFVPLGARWSRDAAARGRDRPVAGATVLSAGSAALVLQFVLLYCFAGLLKTAPTWTDGSAVELALRWNRSGPLADVLLQFPGALRAVTPLVRWFEILAPLLVLVPVRTAQLRVAVVAGFLLLQMGFGLGIDLQLFPWVSTAAALPLLPAGVWDALERRLGIAAADAAPEPERPRPAVRGPEIGRLAGWVGQGTAAMLVAYAIAANFHSTGWIHLSGGVRAWGELLALHQGWTLFAPGPPTWNATFQIYGELADGRVLPLGDARRNGAWDRVRRFQRSIRFRNQLERMVRPPQPEPGARLYLEWICRRWNAEAAPDQRLQRTMLLLFREMLVDPPESRPIRLQETECPPAA